MMPQPNGLVICSHLYTKDELLGAQGEFCGVARARDASASHALRNHTFVDERGKIPVVIHLLIERSYFDLKPHVDIS